MCAVDSCDSPAITRGWCDKHYRRWRSNGDPEVSRRQPRAGSVCAVEGCDRQRHSAAGHCSTHDTRMRKHGDVRADVPILARKPPECVVEGCGKPVQGRGLCTGHYSRWWRGRPVEGPVRGSVPVPANCQFEDCGKPSRARGLCGTHYNRWRVHGDPSVVLLPGRRRRDSNVERKRRECAVAACGRDMLAHTFCQKHLRRWEASGRTDPLYLRPKVEGARHPHWVSDDEVSYGTAHSRVRKARGKASTHRCVDCGGQAQEWSYVGGDPDERVGSDGKKDDLRYSLDPSYYAPRCSGDHIRFDKHRE